MIPIIAKTCNPKKAKDFLAKFKKDRKVCTSSIIIVKPLKKEIAISQIRELKKIITVGTNSPRLIVFYDFHLASLESQNALLKTLEEKILNNQFILFTLNEYSILPTIRSRSKFINLDEKKTKENFSDEFIKLMQKLEQSKNLSFLNDFQGLTKEEIAKNLKNMLLFYRQKILSPNITDIKVIKIIKIVKRILYIINLIEKNNISGQPAFDILLIFINKTFTMKINGK